MHPSRLSRFVAATCICGFAVLALVAGFHGDEVLRQADARFWILAAAILIAELYPIDVPGHEGEVTFSLTFAFALLLTSGMSAVVLVGAVAVGIAEVLRRRPVDRLLFNVAQYALSWAAAGLVFSGLVHGIERNGVGYVSATGAAALAAAAAAFLAVNTLLASTAPALYHGARPLAYVRADLGFEISTTAVLTALVPIVVVVAHFSLWLIPLLGIPLAAIQVGGHQAVVNQHQARHDALTGLPNRAELGRFLAEALEQRASDGHHVGVALMDLDSFKEINDTLGHQHGDLVLLEVARRLREVVGPHDLIARFGGDEFAFVLPGLDHDHDAQRVAVKLLQALHDPVDMQDVALDIRASIGIAVAPGDGEDPDDLLRRADGAVYHAKDRRLGWAAHDRDSEQPSVERLELVGELRRGIEEGQLVLHYQPKVDLRTGQTTSVEALVRWRHPERGLLGPAHFIELAEHTGLIRPLTDYVLQEAAAQARRWSDAGLGLSIGVNVSVRSITDELPAQLARVLAQAGAPARLLELEITESTMASPDETLSVLEAVNELGVPLAVDDFGTGYSSLSYLKRLPVSTIKIDRSFVMSICDDRSDRAIVHSTIDLARELTMRVVAEGVETAEAVDALRRLGCDYAQGYHISRPLPAAAFEEWLRTAGRGPQPAASAP